MSDILAVNPWIYDFAAFDLWAKPLGFLHILSLLKKSGLSVEFVDFLDRWHPFLTESCADYHPRDNQAGCGKFYARQIPKPQTYRDIPRRYKRYGMPPEIFEEYLRRNNPQPRLILLTSCMTYWYPAIQDLMEILRRHYPHTPVALGGIYPILCYEHALKNVRADFTINQYVPLQLNGIIKEVFGINLNLNEETLFSISPYYDSYAKLPYLVLRTSWGCNFDCDFCGLKKMFKGFFQKDPELVFEEIGHFYGKGVENFVFYDDALLFDKEKISQVLEKTIKNRIKIKIHTPNGLHARYIDKKIAVLLKKSGFVMPRLSFESSQEEIISHFSFKVDRSTFEGAVRYLKEAGFKNGQYGVYLIFGAPGQNLDTLNKDIDFCYNLGCKIFLADFSFVPGCMGTSEPPGFHDPLMHNNTIFAFLREQEPEKLQAIKNKVKSLNSRFEL